MGYAGGIVRYSANFSSLKQNPRVVGGDLCFDAISYDELRIYSSLAIFKLS